MWDNATIMMLVEGTFAPDAVLTVQAETPPAQKIDGYTPRSAWSFFTARTFLLESFA